jgi:hypothetical protein
MSPAGHAAVHAAYALEGIAEPRAGRGARREGGP